MSRESVRWSIVVAYTICVVLAFINARSIWLDEALSVLIAQQPFATMSVVLHHIDSVQALYYLLLHFWLHFGSSATSVRMPSAICAVLALIAISSLAKEMFGKSSAPASATILATSTFFLFYADEARSAALTMATCSLAALTFWEGIRRRNFGSIILFGLFSIASIYANFIAVLFIAALFLSTITLRPKRDMLLAISAVAILIGLATLPLVYFIVLNQRYLDQIGTVPSSNPVGVLHFIVRLMGGPSRAEPFEIVLVAVALLVTLCLMGVAVVLDWRSKDTHAGMTASLVWFLTPLVLGIAIDQLIHPILLPRYFSFALIPTALLAGRGLVILRKESGRVLPYAAVAALGTASLHNLSTIQREDWRGVTGLLSQRSHAADAIVFWPPYLVIPFDYASQEIRVKPAARVAYPTSSYVKVFQFANPPPDLTAAIGHSCKRIWLVERLKPVNPRERNPFDALSRYYAQSTPHVFPELRVIELTR